MTGFQFFSFEIKITATKHIVGVYASATHIKEIINTYNLVA